MTIQSSHSMVHRNATLTHAAGKPCTANAGGLDTESGDFADVMGGLMADRSADLMPTSVLTPLAQQSSAGEVNPLADPLPKAPDLALLPAISAPVVPASQMLGRVVASLRARVDPQSATAMAEATSEPMSETAVTLVAKTSLAGQTPTGEANPVADLLAQTPGLAPLPAIATEVAPSTQQGENTVARLGAAPVGLRTSSMADTKNSPAKVVGEKNVLELALDKPVLQRQVDSEALGNQSMVRTPAMALGASKNNALMHAGAAALPQLEHPSVETLQTMLAVPVMPLMPESKDRNRTSLTEAGPGLSGPYLVTDRLGISPTYEVTQASALVADTQIAETVSYWATQGIQNAELTVDGLGSEPVDVRIALDGDQVQVDFRSDQPQVRQVIEAATAQLKTLLLAQGIELSGMSVGSYDQGAHPSGARALKPSHSRTAGVQMIQDVETMPVHRRDSNVGSALDLYV